MFNWSYFNIVMTPVHKFSIRREEQFNNLVGSLGDMRNKGEFYDVSLASEGRHVIRAHKVILSANSALIREFLNKLIEHQPLIYLRGVDGQVLQNIIDFIYD